MKTISGIIGLVLILVAVVIIVLSTGEDSYHAKKEAMVQKYIQNSSKALEEENIDEAIRFAKMAIQVDAKNNAAFFAYDKAMKTKYKPQNTPTQQIQSSPVDEEEDEDEDNGKINVDMGC
jgi:hypothetical protein